MATLCRLDFPIYACDALDDTHVIVAGGGGAAKTGVPNAVEILELEKIGRKCQANPCDRLTTGSVASMNMSVLPRTSDKTGAHPQLLAVGLAGQCHVYSITRSSPTSPTQNSNLKHRKTNNVKKKIEKNEQDASSQIDNFTFKLLHAIDTDTSSEPLQKAVRISRSGKLLVTGGSDGFVRAWNIPSMKERFSSHGHKDDVTDVDISPDGQHVVSVSRDGTAVIWDSTSGLKKTELHSLWNSEMITRKYRFRCCRYGTVIDDAKKHVLFTAHTPVRIERRGSGKDQRCCLTKWSRKRKDGEETGPLRPSILQFTGNEPISTMAVSADGVFIGVGFMEGSIAIYIAFNLKCAKRVSNLHGIFVTGMTFVNNSPLSQPITGPCDAALVSVSADNMCKMTKLSTRTTFPVWFAILVSLLALVLTGLYLQWIGLI